MIVRPGLAFALLLASIWPVSSAERATREDYEAFVVKHARANGIPETLVHRVIVRESRYNARAVGRGGHFGLMQIKPQTARTFGYSGGASGLLDPDTNLTYGVRYLAGAYQVANGNEAQAIRYYSSGYYYVAKRRGMLWLFAKSRFPAAAAAE